MKEWFESWFDTHYYHILYKNRDHSEAEVFIRNLFGALALEKDKKVLDLACGKGRHAILVNSLGYDTTGVDLSNESIETAKKSQNNSLHFFQHDMRLPIVDKKFDLVLNLFTSFGYFETMADNIEMLKSVYSYLEKDGILVIDFMNANKEIEKLVAKDCKSIEGIDFEISKSVNNGHIIKDIRFEDKGETFHYQEKVQALKLKDFEQFLEEANFKIEGVFGNYQLNDFDSNADRLIIVAKKNNE